mmetsp:Transcript_3207/g.6355  ORF Transcript_3207/g.6355 Transcript_3207/m.6355 type:complete len:239 (+) Transcript_3207:142-858(+)
MDELYILLRAPAPLASRLVHASLHKSTSHLRLLIQYFTLQPFDHNHRHHGVVQADCDLPATVARRRERPEGASGFRVRRPDRPRRAAPPENARTRPLPSQEGEADVKEVDEKAEQGPEPGPGDRLLDRRLHRREDAGPARGDAGERGGFAPRGRRARRQDGPPRHQRRRGAEGEVHVRGVPAGLRSLLRGLPHRARLRPERGALQGRQVRRRRGKARPSRLGRAGHRGGGGDRSPVLQ